MSSQPVSLPTLPAEMREYVVDHLFDDMAEGSLVCLARTCRDFHKMVIVRLYSKDHLEKHHRALLFWAVQFGRYSTANRLLSAGISVNRLMVRNESMPNLMLRLGSRTPRQIYQYYRTMNNQLGPHDSFQRVGPRGYVEESISHFQRPPGAISQAYHQSYYMFLNLPRWQCWWFPLHLAVRGGFMDLVQLLISHGAYLGVGSGGFCHCRYPTLLADHASHTERPNFLPIHVAICNGRTDIAKFLLEKIASAYLSIPRAPHSILHSAASVGNVVLVDHVLDMKYQTDVQALDAYGMSPIWYAYLQGHWHVVDALLTRGANIDDDLGTGYTPLVDACLFGDFLKAIELIKRGADVNTTCTAYPSLFDRLRNTNGHYLESLRGHRPIDLCCLKQQSRIRSLRYKRPFIVPRPGMPPPPPPPLTMPYKVHVPEECYRFQLVEALLDGGADMGAGKHSPLLAPPLVSAAAEHLECIVWLLLKHGAPVDSTDKEGNTPLMAAMSYHAHWCDSHAKVGPLSSRPFAMQRPNRGAAVHTVPTITNFITCRYQGLFQNCVKMLIKHGANPAAVNKLGASPLTLVYSPAKSELKNAKYKYDLPEGHLTFKERAEVVSMLIKLGCDPNTTINLKDPVDGQPDAENDNFSVYSGTESDTSEDVSPDDDSDAGSIRTRTRSRPRSLHQWGPLSVLQCAFWDGDVDLCRILLQAGAELTTPIVAWMLHLTYGYCRYRMGPAAREVLQVLGDLDPGLQVKLGSHPICLLVLISHRVTDLAEEIIPHIARDEFDEIFPVTGYHWLTSDAARLGQLSVTWGALCLSEAVVAHQHSIVTALLDLGIDPNTPGLSPPYRPLTKAIEDEDIVMLDLLISHGADVNITTTPSTSSPDNPVIEFSRTDKSNPLINAIRRDDAEVIAVILRHPSNQGPIPEKFAYAYIREAYMIRAPGALAALLAFDSLHPHGVSGGEEAQTHVTDLIKNIIPICDYDTYDVDDEDVVPWAISVRVKLERVRVWMECLIVLARSGVDPGVRNWAGLSGMDLFGVLINYDGRDRFWLHVRSVLRSRLNDVLGEDVVSGDVMDPVVAWTVLASCEDMPGSGSSSSSSSSRIDDGLE